MRWVLAAVLASLLATPASAEPGWIEAGGFVGVNDLPQDIKLGGSLEPEQRPQTAPNFGGRLTWVALPLGALELGVEAEAAITASWTGYGFATRRPSYFAPVLAYRGDVIVRLAELEQFKPFVRVGGGGDSVVSHSPYLRDTSDPQLFYGIGAAIEVDRDLQLRIDGTQGFIATEVNGHGATYELALGVFGVFGRAAPVAPPPPPPVVEPPPPPPPPIVEPPPPPPPPPIVEPPPPPDPTKDSDGDGIPDVVDKCPNEPETKNGWQDDDGCPDTVPDDIVQAFAAASAVRFEPRRVRLSDAAKAAFEPALTVLRAHPHLHVHIVGHPVTNEATSGVELAKKRAEVVKWHLVEQGIPEDQLDTVIGDPLLGASHGAVIELVLVPSPPSGPPRP